MNNFLNFGTFRSDDFEVVVYPLSAYSVPRKKYDEFKIPGRNGTVRFFDGTYENIKKKYAVLVYNVDDPEIIMENIYGRLHENAGYCELEDSFEPNYFLFASLVDEISIKKSTSNRQVFRFDLTFNCMPQKFLKSGDVFVENPSILKNPTFFASHPIFEITPSATECTISFGTSEIILDGLTIEETVFVDCELVRAYTESAEDLTGSCAFSGDLMLAAKTETVISAVGASAIKVKPRWWTL